MLAIHQRKNDVVLSIGEIDQRVSYKHAIKNARDGYDSYLSSLLKGIDYAIDYVASLRAPHQKFYAVALPSFDANLLDIGQSEQKNVNLVSDQISKDSERYHEKCESVGIEILGKNLLQNSSVHSHLLDHAHFHPEIYKMIFTRSN